MAKPRLADLCDLITASLLPFLEPKPPSQLTRESEKRLLLALSRVNKVIRGWIREEEEAHRCGSDSQETMASFNKLHNCGLQPVQPFDNDCRCLSNIIFIMVGFLDFCSGYVKHAAENILFAVSSCLTKFESIWIKFVKLVWVAIHAALSISTDRASTSTTVSASYIAESSTYRYFLMENQEVDIDISSSNIMSFIRFLKQRHIAMSSQMLPGLFRVLHTILKSLKNKDSELEGNYIRLSILHLQKVPWDSFGQLTVDISSPRDDELDRNNGLVGAGILSGMILRLLCSLVKQTDLEDLDDWVMYSKLAVVVPKLLSLFFNETCGGDVKCFSQYLKHKMLMLMIQLKSHMQQQQHYSHIVLWLTLVKQYFQDHLYDSISQYTVDFDNCLEGSPFLSSIPNVVKMHNSCTRHLQRQATYLFLSCCFSLVRINNDIRCRCLCQRDASLFSYEPPACSDHCSRLGLSEISEWFERCYCLEEIGDSKSSVDFAICFLKLYMEEDDMLFSMLLQLLDVPFICLQVKSIESKRNSEVMSANLLSTIFDPVHLFHLVLLLLHYDHLVLVDYLISKDTGVHCAQYLLRCLRLVSQSWHTFVDDSIYKGEIDKLSSKRQRISMDLNDTRKDSIPAPVASFIVDGSKLGCNSGRTSENNNLQLFGNAIECLLSLKKTVEDLHQKDLFPYNPKPLLRSLSRFKELCTQEINFSHVI